MSELYFASFIRGLYCRLNNPEAPEHAFRCDDELFFPVERTGDVLVHRRPVLRDGGDR